MPSSTPRKKVSPSHTTATTGGSSSSSSTRLTPKKLYLVLYNSLAGLGWLFALTCLVQHLTKGGWDGTVKGALGLETVQEKLVHQSRTGYADFGDVVKYVQTTALLEVVHVVLGLVRSGLGTTMAQISSRILLVWYICPFYPQVTATPWYCSMVFAWSVTEIIRYTHYVVTLLNSKVYLLEWLRYTTFYVLYPLGAASEAALIFKTAPYAREHFGNLGFFGTVALCAGWPPALMVMMNHMHRQRYKHLVNPQGKKVSSATKAKIEAAQANSVAASASASGTDTPTRVTRSRAKAGAA